MQNLVKLAAAFFVMGAFAVTTQASARPYHYYHHYYHHHYHHHYR